jgi:hypothetical protein
MHHPDMRALLWNLLGALRSVLRTRADLLPPFGFSGAFWPPIHPGRLRCSSVT